MSFDLPWRPDQVVAGWYSVALQAIQKVSVNNPAATEHEMLSQSYSSHVVILQKLRLIPVREDRHLADHKPGGTETVRV